MKDAVDIWATERDALKAQGKLDEPITHYCSTFNGPCPQCDAEQAAKKAKEREG